MSHIASCHIASYYLKLRSVCLYPFTSKSNVLPGVRKLGQPCCSRPIQRLPILLQAWQSINGFLIFNMRSAESIFVNSLQVFKWLSFCVFFSCTKIYLEVDFMLIWRMGMVAFFFSRMSPSVTAVTAQSWTRHFQPHRAPLFRFVESKWPSSSSLRWNKFNLVFLIHFTTNSIAFRQYNGEAIWYARIISQPRGVASDPKSIYRVVFYSVGGHILLSCIIQASNIT